MYRHEARYRILTFLLSLAVVGSLGVATRPAAAADGTLQSEFAAAAAESKVPAPVLLAVSYALTRWDDHGPAASASGGYGPMHLTDVDPADVRAEDARGTGADVDAAAIEKDESLHRLDAAAKLLGVDAEQLKTDRALNIRGGALLLAHHVGTTPKDLAGWYPAVAWYSGASATGADAFADDVFESMRAGAARTTTNGQRVSLPKTAVTTPARARAADPAVECPSGVTCRFVPAAYAWNNTADPNDYGNYDPADRPADGDKIRYIVIHDTESSYESTIAAAQNPLTYVASHYVIRSSDGEITQMIRTKDVGWHAGNWNINQTSIGIEHEGVAREGATWYTEAMYRSSAKLVRYLAAKYQIPLDRNHIIGHDEVPGRDAARVATQHWDPGPFWDWQHYMDLIKAPVRSAAALKAGDVVTISPDFATNRQAIPGCSPTPCQDLPEQGTNFTFLYSAPQDDAPLISDPALQPSGSPGTRNAEDWGDKATFGRQYVVAGVQGDWVAIWWAGQQAWIHDPTHTIVKRCGVAVKTITPAAGKTSIPTYGKAFPDASEYPSGITPDVGTPLQYTIAAGQKYVVGEVTPAANYYARFDGANVPMNHTVIKGAQTYLAISLNHRWAYVKLSDVVYG
ncbi:N-acetylmuramoyl-L-alanine amidase [Cryptosporangium phraense]|uniref:N-acetylmuramoyl-L-alanine amidase n=1 Tax=Cryptosporangium phraense TaxID=2593070 RepID=A0A545AGB3_9ACTN|nr:peptidoglycan recognition family protein [Cryptosporangium phraense]TQS40366.1 N-acetylmuramoyl-L-alanine amidase [Cryptosporangium phraense]